MTLDKRIAEATEVRNARHLAADEKRREAQRVALLEINDVYQREINQAESDWRETLRQCRESAEHQQAVEAVKQARAVGELPKE